MNLTPFNIYYLHNDAMDSVQIRPCCREANVVDYAVWQDDELAYTITKHPDTHKWVIAMKNADDDIDDGLVQLLGSEIEKRMNEKHDQDAGN